MVATESATQTMEHIEALLAFLAVPFKPSALKPVRSRLRIGPLGHGELRAEILAALRLSATWMTYNELAEVIKLKFDITLTPKQHRHFVQKLREAVHALKGHGAVEPERHRLQGEFDTEQRWRLSPTLFRAR